MQKDMAVIKDTVGHIAELVFLAEIGATLQEATHKVSNT